MKIISTKYLYDIEETNSGYYARWVYNNQISNPKSITYQEYMRFRAILNGGYQRLERADELKGEYIKKEA
jgi:hypothetical protein